MTVDDKLIHYLERLARIELSEGERADCKDDIRDIIDYFGTLSDIEEESVEYKEPLINVMRADTVVPSVEREDILLNAPVAKDGAFSVPKTVE